MASCSTQPQLQLQPQTYPAPFPPSPPPSPTLINRRRNPPKSKAKSSDPFLTLHIAAAPLSVPSTPQATPPQQDSLLTRVVISPVLFISFLLSLALVNWRDRVRRYHARHAQETGRLLLWLWSSPRSWVGPEPYQDPRDGTWGIGTGGGHVATTGLLRNSERRDRYSKQSPPAKQNSSLPSNVENKSWFLHHKIRAVAKLEVSDALELRGRLIAAMGLIMLFAVLGLVLGVRWLVQCVWG